MGSTTMESSAVDVLIVGAGPAGLMTANWMSRLGVKTRIIDKRGTKVLNSIESFQHKLTIPQDLQRPSRRSAMPLTRDIRQFRLRRQSVAGIQPHAGDQPVESGRQRPDPTQRQNPRHHSWNFTIPAGSPPSRKDRAFLSGLHRGTLGHPRRTRRAAGEHGVR